MFEVVQSHDAVGSWYVVSQDGDFVRSFDDFYQAERYVLELEHLYGEDE